MTDAILSETHTLPGKPAEYADRLYTDSRLTYDAHQQAGAWFSDLLIPQGRAVGNAIVVDYDNRTGVAAMRFTFRPQPGSGGAPGTRVDAECFDEGWADHYRRLLDLLLPEGTRATAQPAPPKSQAKATPARTGMRAGTDDRVRHMHQLLKAGQYSYREVQSLAHINTPTYYKHCKRVTGEEPITPAK